MTITPEQVLFVLNDCEHPALDALDFCVITAGSTYSARGEKLPPGSEPNYWPFERGELLVLGDSGREPFGQGRKPSKWDVTTFETKDFDAAHALSTTIKASVRPGLWEWADGAWTRPVDQAAVKERMRCDGRGTIARIGREAGDA